MLVLIYHLGKDRYALDASLVIEVLPLVELKRVPCSERGVAGVLNYRGAPVPVIDLGELALGRPSDARLSTRIILVNYSGANGEKNTLGLMAEQATETARRPRSDFVESGVAGAPYLGPVAPDPRGLLQLIEVEKLLPEALRDSLFREVAEVGA